MVVLRLIIQAIVLYLLVNIPSVLIVIFAYWLIPSQFTLLIMGGFATIIAIVYLVCFVFIYGASLLGLGAKSEISPEPIDSSSDTIRELIASLESLGFRHLGNTVLKNKFWPQQNSSSLVYLHENGHVEASISIGGLKVSPITLSYSTLWEAGQFVVTVSNPTGFIIHKAHYRYTTVKNDAVASYRYHLEQVKEMRETADKSLKIESLEQYLDLSHEQIEVFATDCNYQAIAATAPTTFIMVLLLLSFAALFVEASAFFRLLPEADMTFPTRATGLFSAMTGLLFYSVHLFVQKKKYHILRALDTEAKEGESLLGDNPV